MYFSNKKAAMAKIRNQVCSARNPTTCPDVLTRKVATWPITPGSVDPIFAQMSLRPAPKALPMAFKAFVTVPTTTPIVTPAAKRMEVTVMPYFLKIFLILSQRGNALSRSST